MLVTCCKTIYMLFYSDYSVINTDITLYYQDILYNLRLQIIVDSVYKNCS